jgi:hypothetical protein
MLWKKDKKYIYLFFVNTSCLGRLVYKKQCFENPNPKQRHGNYYSICGDGGG